MFENKLPPETFLSKLHLSERKKPQRTWTERQAKKQLERAQAEAKALTTVLFGLKRHEGKSVLRDGRSIEIQLLLIDHPASAEELLANGHPADRIKITVPSNRQKGGYELEWIVGTTLKLNEYREYDENGHQIGCVIDNHNKEYSAVDMHTEVPFDPLMQFRVYKQCADLMSLAAKAVVAQQALTLSP
jgi:hypothetical protein